MRYGYQEKVFTSVEGGFEMCNVKGTDGLLYADRTPLPNYYELQHNYAQAAVIDSVFNDTLHVRNRYDFINLKDNISFHWTVTDGQQSLAQGSFSPDCQPHQTTAIPLRLPTLPKDRLLLLNIEVKNKQGWTLLHQSLKLQSPPLIQSQTINAAVGDMIQKGPLVRVGRKMTMAEKLRVEKERIDKYLQPLSNPYVRAEVLQNAVTNGTTKGEARQASSTVSYELTPDTTRRFLSELGVAYLLDKRIDRVQWLGYGPYASYPGRHQANRYGLWSLQQDDLYFEGNRMGVEAAWLSDKEGNGILITGKELNISFEQTDLGIVVTVNAAVSGLGPKFGRTAFGVWSDTTGSKTGSFQLMRTEAGQVPQPFMAPSVMPSPFHPYLTQYDTYLLRFNDIYEP